MSAIFGVLTEDEGVHPLIEIRDFLETKEDCPEHTPKGENYSGCDVGRYLNAAIEALKPLKGC
jgi:hypothetical protein